jgi:3-hydroxyisobutyrate dehydrogenase
LRRSDVRQNRWARPLAVLEVIGGGAAGSVQLNVQGPRMIKGDFAPGFMLEHFVKDIGLAIAEADRMDLKLPGLTRPKNSMTS